MRALVQRVKRARVDVEGELVGSIDQGLLIFLGVHADDTNTERDWLINKCANLRVFHDQDGKMNLSLASTGFEALVVSQFTLYGDANKGNRPSFNQSARPEHAEPMYEAFVDGLASALGRPVATGRFGAMMEVDLVNDGPVTIWLDRPAKARENPQT